ncbi:MAG: PAS domain S-box protein [SAR324 cluster bacterium]|nr:PAS domain S-box protein [SAR324 cluster bacterium]
MKISHKLLLSYILIALFISTGCYLGIEALHKIRFSFNEVNREYLPVIQTLENIKFAGLRIISSTSEFVFLKTEQQHSQMDVTASALQDEKNEIESSKKAYQQALQNFTTLAEQFTPEYDEILVNIKSAGKALQKTSHQIIHFKEQGIEGQQVLAAKEKMELQEQVFLEVIEAAIQHEVEEQNEGHAHVLSAIDTAVTIIVVGAGSSVIIVLFFIVLTISSLAISINKLKDAAVEIGKGKLNTTLDIQSRDELGILAKAFNQMVLDLNKAYQEIESSKNYLQNIIHSMTDMLIVIKPDTTIRTANSITLNLLGYQSDELIGEPIGTIIEEKEVFLEDAGIRKLIEEGTVQNLEKIFISKNGDKIPVLFSGSRIKNQENTVTGFVCVALDITSRKQAEEERLRLATAIEQAAESIIITDQAGHIQYANPAFETVTGYTREEALGKNPSFLKSGKHDASFYKEMWDTITTGSVWKGHITNRKKDGALYEEESTISPVRNEDGNIVSYVGVKKDVTKELLLEKQLRQSQKMEALGTLAGGIAHDFNNMLGVILGNIEMLAEDYADHEDLMASLNPVFIAAKRAANLVEQILTFSRMEVSGLISVDIAGTVREAVQMVRSTIPANIEIQHHVPETCPSIMANPTQIHQIVLNLCTNAYHAMEETGGILEVTLQDKLYHNDSSQAETSSNLQENTLCLQLTISDTGIGIPVESREKIFDPFFTTKEVGKGTGLGLSVVHGIVMHHKGVMTVASESGKGTRFTLSFAVVDEQESAVAPIITNMVKRSSAHILIVDDEPGLTQMYQKFLQKQGYTVTIQNNGLDAWHTFQETPDRYDLVLTDQSMPNLAGKQLSQKILEIRPDIPIILVTGYSHAISEDSAKRIGVRSYLMKPVTLRTLQQTIEDCLRKADGT